MSRPIWRRRISHDVMCERPLTQLTLLIKNVYLFAASTEKREGRRRHWSVSVVFRSLFEKSQMVFFVSSLENITFGSVTYVCGYKNIFKFLSGSVLLKWAFYKSICLKYNKDKHLLPICFVPQWNPDFTLSSILRHLYVIQQFTSF